MNIEFIEDQKTWEVFFDNAGSPSFLHSWEWGEFQKNLGYKTLRVGLYEKTKPVLMTLVVIVKSKRGNFLFVPHGPLEINNLKFKIRNYLEKFRDFLIDIAKREDCSFIRIAPVLDDNNKNRQLFQDLGFKKAPIYMHAERMWILPLTSEVLISSIKSQTSEVKTDDQILSQMRKTTRYSIRRAQRDGVIIEKRTDKKAVDDFYAIYEETAKREKFVPFSKDFIKKEFDAFHKTGNAVFLFGRLHSINLASALILFTESTAFYHQGASIHTKVPTTYLLQWEAIKEAKKRGCRFYNFWGILQEGRSPKNWQGLTLFKTGFGGFQKDCVPTQDYIVSPTYYFTYLYEWFLKWKRGV